MKIIKQKQLALLMMVAGAIGGFLYWRFVGCESGTCAIKSVWYWSTLWGAAVGYLLGDAINDFVVKRKKRTEENDSQV
ncbi:DUF6132 family protein [Draconibacterium sp. IB214405]|uniref:DUF6132 family protein n=1 Tax=Draconibacterium sp. IB214405 TaxID=3097352 RepID=UPI002A11BB77|nr:DUF6132 family protein [Draconibacterium sp. IB214405]MDX8340041.1 DUF6132 family protein [Draconibacterium sp. IB214405]